MTREEAKREILFAKREVMADSWIDKAYDVAIKALEQPEQRWIPCSERLPKERGFYLVSVGAPYKQVRVYEYKPCEEYENENLWKSYDGSYCFNWFVEAWMPLPEPYRGEQG